MHAILTYIGIVALHSSVDLLNDYWDYKRGIDKITRRTPFSGGTGVLPEGLLNPRDVYKVGILMLIIGSLIGLYFVMVKGIIVAIILAFAIISIYFYSNKVVNLGLGELFVAIKGSMIVLGTFYVQTSIITLDAIYNSVIIGLLSSTVLFINAFPDHDADKGKGRKTLVIILGKENASRFFILFPTLIYSLIIIGIIMQITPVYAISTFIALPLAISAMKRLSKNRDADLYVMNNIVKFSRFVGILLLISFILASIINI
jgi:1,4-dihydroxy-2-naphthoate octaprenyltransferase